VKISASIYSNKEKDLEKLVRELDAHHIDMFHVDCADNDKVFEDIASIRKVSSTPIDLHIISSEPEKYFDRIEKLKIEYVSFQYENLKKLPVLPPGITTKFGLSVLSSTSLDVIENLKESGYSFVIIMCTTPGKSGGTFNGDSFQKIIEFKYRFPKTQIHVDGGINDQVAFILRLLGVNAIVSGSYLLNHESLGAGMLSFHKTPNNKPDSYRLADFAVPVKYLPVLKNASADFKTVLQAIEKFALGFVAITDENDKLEGIISNADVRRALLRNLNDLNKVQLNSLVNTNPVSIIEKASLADMIKLLNELNFIVLFLPVVDDENHLKGAVLLNNLTRV
jgi:ribulose-phosphate 3-epimerase